MKLQRRIAARILKVGENRVWINPEKLADVKEAITKEDVRSLIKEGAIKVRSVKGVSKGRFRKVLKQKRKGMRKGAGRKEGKRSGRRWGKKVWMKKVRLLRKLLTEHKTKMTLESYWKIRKTIKAGAIKDKKHLIEMIRSAESTGFGAESTEPGAGRAGKAGSK
ncbi:MAG TPA: 50S ribosomal protein L19e [Nanoarchaeota archaeon]|nr:MAG: 50S ribosomal protein L19e, large subunit ribosomal protein L19e [archaeon GW2011_AR6]MBS3082785.1 50S ribosomal protein L19e [Candidatus Pacearchaeota archaeon]HIH17839.1 50S ribosomal protein L19e [Nanoarchaeota archaeon]HIH34095.1 50S ribosomal protein L19e [Nanoarchaeota archaeon]HIH50948.1 50S ribosomal protein L19e [Nanoarchaeota archaeon]